MLADKKERAGCRGRGKAGHRKHKIATYTLKEKCRPAGIKEKEITGNLDIILDKLVSEGKVTKKEQNTLLIQIRIRKNIKGNTEKEIIPKLTLQSDNKK